MSVIYYSKKFQLKYNFRGGAIVWAKYQDKHYYLVFKSLTRPNRGVQLPGGRIERDENPSNTIVREVKEETGVDTRIVCPLGFLYAEDCETEYSSLQLYFIVKPIFRVNLFKKWYFVDDDINHQELECWFVEVNQSMDFLHESQKKIVEMFREWLIEHQKTPNHSS